MEQMGLESSIFLKYLLSIRFNIAAAPELVTLGRTDVSKGYS